MLRKQSPYRHRIEKSSTEAGKGSELSVRWYMLCAKMWGRQIRPKWSCRVRCRGKVQAQTTIRETNSLWVGEKHGLRSIRGAASSPSINPHLVPVFHSGMANSPVQDQDAKAERLILAPLLRFRSTDLNAIFSCKHPRYANITSKTSIVTACSQAELFGFFFSPRKTDNYSAVFITKTAKPAVLSYRIFPWSYRVEI